MQLVTTAERLTAALSAADGIVKGGSVLGPTPAAQLLVERGVAQVIASDGAVSLRTVLATSSATDGSVVVTPHPIASFAASLPTGTRVEVRVDAGRLVVVAGQLAYRFSILAGAYPAIEEAGGSVQTGPTVGLAGMLAAVRHAADPRSSMVKLAAEDAVVRMYATDSYRLCVASHPHPGGRWSILIPVQWLQYALRHDPQQLDVDQRGRLATFRSPDTAVTIRLGAAAFPAVESALQHPPTHTATVETRDLVAAANRLANVADGEPFRVRVEPQQLTLSAASSIGDGTETVTARSDGSGAFGVAVKNFLDAVGACGDTVELRYGDPKQPIWCLGSRDGINVHCVVMPTFWQHE